MPAQLIYLLFLAKYAGEVYIETKPDIIYHHHCCAEESHHTREESTGECQRNRTLKIQLSWLTQLIARKTF